MAAGDSGGYGRRDWAAVAAGLGVEASVESVISGGGNGGGLMPSWSEEVSLLLHFLFYYSVIVILYLSLIHVYPTSLSFIYY